MAARKGVRTDSPNSLNEAVRADHNALVTDVAAILTALKNMALSAAGLAIGSVSKKTLKIVNTVVFLNAGVFKSKATVAVAFTATTHDIAAHATLVKEAVYLVSLAADGTPTVTMGAIAAGAGTAVVPATPTGKTPIAHARIAVAAGATPFDATSDDLDAAHLTVTYTDIAMQVPTATAVTALPK